MAQVRALTTLFHDGALLKAGDIFDYPDELAGKLKGDITEGLELVTKKTTAAFQKALTEAHQALVDKAVALRNAYDAMKADLEANPTRTDLVQQLLDAEAAAIEAEKAATEATPETV